MDDFFSRLGLLYHLALVVHHKLTLCDLTNSNLKRWISLIVHATFWLFDKIIKSYFFFLFFFKKVTFPKDKSCT